jgi:hypothetical protein
MLGMAIGHQPYVLFAEGVFDVVSSGVMDDSSG